MEMKSTWRRNTWMEKTLNYEITWKCLSNSEKKIRDDLEPRWDNALLDQYMLL